MPILSRHAMSIFPLRKRPAASYKERPRGFENPRANGARKHAGCDLYAPAGTEVLAVEAGEVIPRQHPFPDLRANGARKHAGCDLYAPAGTEVLAVEDGEVIAGPYPFYDVVDAVEIRHASGIIVRYGEISKTGAPGIKTGAKVRPPDPEEKDLIPITAEWRWELGFHPGDRKSTR